jgi:putative endonuclease
MYYFYLFQCADGTLYSGSTKDIKNREKLHNAGKGARYTRIHGGGKIVYFEEFITQRQAMQREVEVKKWPRAKKEGLFK